MSRTDLDATTLANILRTKAGDGSVEWVYEPIQASVLLDIADMLDENAKLRELALNLYKRFHGVVLENWSYSTDDFDMLACRMRKLGVEVDG